LGNLPFRVDKYAIKHFFEDCGLITDLAMVTKNSKFTGNVFLEFENAESVEKACQKNGTLLQGRSVIVQRATPRPEGKKQYGAFSTGKTTISPKTDGCKGIFVGNLTFSIEDLLDDVLRNHFRECGEIASIKYVQKDGKFRGCAFVEFTTTEATDKAVTLDGRYIGGRCVRVDYGTKLKKE